MTFLSEANSSRKYGAYLSFLILRQSSSNTGGYIPKDKAVELLRGIGCQATIYRHLSALNNFGWIVPVKSKYHVRSMGSVLDLSKDINTSAMRINQEAMSSVKAFKAFCRWSASAEFLQRNYVFKHRKKTYTDRHGGRVRRRLASTSADQLKIRTRQRGDVSLTLASTLCDGNFAKSTMLRSLKEAEAMNLLSVQPMFAHREISFRNASGSWDTRVELVKHQSWESVLNHVSSMDDPDLHLRRFVFSVKHQAYLIREANLITFHTGMSRMKVRKASRARARMLVYTNSSTARSNNRSENEKTGKTQLKINAL